MKKQLGLITSLVAIAVTALCWVGCARGYQDSCCYEAPARHAECCVAEPEPCCPPPCAAPVRCAHGPQGEICCDGVSVTATQPKLCILGDNYALDICIKACVDVCHVEVNAMLPEGVTLVRSEPAGVKEEKGVLNWTFDAMQKGETHQSRVILRADREGDLCVCFCVTAVPVRFCSALCAKPVLECSKCGPEQVCPGETVHYTISVTNRGSCEATDVVVVDNVPDGLVHASGQRKLVWELGTLCPCETRTIDVCFCAEKRGTVCNTVNVTACNANPVSCQACTCICCCLCEVTKVGPKERKIGESADYTITVTNPGDLVLHQVTMSDFAPVGTSIVEAPGACVNGNQAVWRWDEMKPGESQTVTLTLTTCTPGYYVNNVEVRNCEGCNCCAEWGTRFRGTPALNGCFEDSKDPICLGEVNSYSLRVTNQGQEEDTNLKIVVKFPSQMVPVATHGDAQGTISGNTVTFEAVPVIGSRQSFDFRVDAQAKERGDARIKAEISSDTIRNPITLEESTIIN